VEQGFEGRARQHAANPARSDAGEVSHGLGASHGVVRQTTGSRGRRARYAPTQHRTDGKTVRHVGEARSRAQRDRRAAHVQGAAKGTHPRRHHAHVRVGGVENPTVLIPKMTVLASGIMDIWIIFKLGMLTEGLENYGGGELQCSHITHNK